MSQVQLFAQALSNEKKRGVRLSMPGCHKIFLLFLPILLLASNVLAEKLYKSRDEKGNLVFSDKPIAGTRVIGVQQVRVSRRPCFTARKKGTDADFELYGVNSCQGPVEVQSTLADSENIALNRPERFTTVFSAREGRPVAHLWQADRRRGYRYTYSHSSVPGNPRARHLPRRPYLLPIPADRKFRISQGFRGNSTHTHPQSEFAIDIPMPEGTSIHAARSGVIMEVANDFFTGGKEPQYGERANFIRILHDDGTMAIYAHLKLESLRYPVGTEVRRGQFIAESGNTGYSSGPHLHFAIQKNFGMELRSIPFRFENSSGRVFTPKRGMTVAR